MNELIPIESAFLTGTQVKIVRDLLVEKIADLCEGVLDRELDEHFLMTMQDHCSLLLSIVERVFERE